MSTTSSQSPQQRPHVVHLSDQIETISNHNQTNQPSSVVCPSSTSAFDLYSRPQQQQTSIDYYDYYEPEYDPEILAEVKREIEEEEEMARQNLMNNEQNRTQFEPQIEEFNVNTDQFPPNVSVESVDYNNFIRQEDYDDDDDDDENKMIDNDNNNNQGGNDVNTINQSEGLSEIDNRKQYVAHLEKSNENLTNAYVTLETYCTNLETYCTNLETENHSLNEQFLKSQENCDTLEEDYENLIAQLESVQLLLHSLKSLQISKVLQSELDSKQITQLQAKLERTQQEKSVAMAQFEQTNSKLSITLTEKETLQTEVNMLKEEMNILKSQKLEATKVDHHPPAPSIGLEGEVDNLKQQIVTIESKLEEINLKLTDINKISSLQTLQIEALNAQLVQHAQQTVTDDQQQSTRQVDECAINSNAKPNCSRLVMRDEKEEDFNDGDENRGRDVEDFNLQLSSLTFQLTFYYI